MPYRYPYSKRFIARAIELAVFLTWRIAATFCREGMRQSNPTKKVLIVEPFQLGDAISLTATLAALDQVLSNKETTVWTQPKNRNVFEDDSRVSKIVTCTFPWAAYGKKRGSLTDWRDLFATIRGLRKQRFDLGIDTRGDIRSQVLLLLAGCTERVGCTDYSGSNISARGLLLTTPVNLLGINHRYLRNYHLIERYSQRTLPALTMPTILRSELSPSKKEDFFRIVIHPSGGWVYKRWNPTNWRELISRLSAVANVAITLVGTKADIEVVNLIIYPPLPNVDFYETTYQELKKLLSKANLFIGLDSGPMNLAAAMNVPVLALFGPGDSASWHPLSASSRYIHHVERFPCNPCFQTTCPYSGNNCMDAIFVSEVVDVATNIINTERQQKTYIP